MSTSTSFQSLRDVARDTHAASTRSESGRAIRRLFVAVITGVSWGAMAPIIWQETSVWTAIAVLGPPLIAVSLWAR